MIILVKSRSIVVDTIFSLKELLVHIVIRLYMGVYIRLFIKSFRLKVAV